MCLRSEATYSKFSFTVVFFLETIGLSHDFVYRAPLPSLSQSPLLEAPMPASCSTSASCRCSRWAPSESTYVKDGGGDSSVWSLEHGFLPYRSGGANHGQRACQWASSEATEDCRPGAPVSPSSRRCSCARLDHEILHHPFQCCFSLG
jgi:hypothetical protein